MLYHVALFVGSLLISFILMRGIGWLPTKIQQNPLGLAHLIAGTIAMGVGGFGLAEGGSGPSAARTVVPADARQAFSRPRSIAGSRRSPKGGRPDRGNSRSIRPRSGRAPDP